jgi:hypothetical protein
MNRNISPLRFPFAEREEPPLEPTDGDRPFTGHARFLADNGLRFTANMARVIALP